MSRERRWRQLRERRARRGKKGQTNGNHTRRGCSLSGGAKSANSDALDASFSGRTADVNAKQNPEERSEASNSKQGSVRSETLWCVRGGRGPALWSPEKRRFTSFSDSRNHLQTARCRRAGGPEESALKRPVGHRGARGTRNKSTKTIVTERPDRRTGENTDEGLQRGVCPNEGCAEVTNSGERRGGDRAGE